MNNYFGLIEHYQDYLPIAKEDKIISLGEGDTPLIPLPNLAKKHLPGISIWAKYEGLNPTGSFKDRGMTMAVTHAYNSGSKAVICASTGNTSAAAAAYASRANMDCFVLIPEGKIAMGKLAQAMMYGAKIIQISGNFDEAMELVKQVGKDTPISIVNSINPYRLQGQKTAAFEIVDALSQAPDFHYLPVGNAGNISAYWMGYREYFEHQKMPNLPRMVGYQAEGAAPFVRGARVDNPETIATAIRIGNPQSWDLAEEAKEQSNGHISMLSDEQILHAQYELASEEGVFCEPASAASIGGAIIDYKKGLIPEGSTLVCTLTGNGLKDPDMAIESSQDKVQTVSIDATYDSVKKAIVG
jgi:threonine synthase